MCDKMCVDLIYLVIIYRGMFPYNDEVNAWISGNTNSKTKFSNRSLIYSFICALFVALFLTTIPLLLYFSGINLKNF